MVIPSGRPCQSQRISGMGVNELEDETWGSMSVALKVKMADLALFFR